MNKILFFLTIIISLNSSLANSSEVLRILTWDGYTPDTQLNDFKKLVKTKYNLDLEFKITYAKQFEEYFNGLRGNRFDLVTPINDIIKDESYELISNKLIMPLNLKHIPNAKKLFRSLQNPNYAVDNSKVYALPLVQGPYGLMYNEDLNKIPPKSWSELWNPAFTNKYSIGNLPNFNVITVALSLNYKGEDLFNYEVLKNDPRISSRLVELIKNSSIIWDGVDVADDIKNLSLTAGYGFSIPELKKKSQKWKFATLKEGSVWWVDNWVMSSSLSKNEKLLKIAEDFINFTLSEKYQADVFVRGTATFPTNQNTISILTKTEKDFFQLDNSKFINSNRVILHGLTRRNRNGIMKIWSDALETSKRKIGSK